MLGWGNCVLNPAKNIRDLRCNRATQQDTLITKDNLLKIITIAKCPTAVKPTVTTENQALLYIVVINNAKSKYGTLYSMLRSET